MDILKTIRCYSCGKIKQESRSTLDHNLECFSCQQKKVIRLSEDLKRCRADRPDEWTMDRFIKAAEKLENQNKHIEIHLLKQARRVRNYSNINDIFEAVPVTMFTHEKVK